MPAEPKGEMGLKMMQIYNPRNEGSPIILNYKKIDSPEEKKAFPEELSLLTLKYRLLHVKVGERVPLFSRVDEHKWLLTKDRFGVLYFILAHKSFEENFVFKLQSKVQVLVENNYEELTGTDEAAAEAVRANIEDIVDQFNNALSRNAQADVLISSDQSNQDIRSVDAEIIDFNQAGDIPISIDENDVFVIVDKRNDRLFIIQVITIGAAFLSLVLAILDLVVGFKVDGPK